MRRLIHRMWLCVLILCSVLWSSVCAQNVGIGTASPRVKLEVQEGHVLIDGTPAAAFPDLGAGRRLQWDQNLGALRIGTVTGVLWNTAFSGENSFAGGRDVSARAAQSFAWGTNTNAIGAHSIAIGDDQLTVFTGSVAIGRQTQNISDSAIILNTGGPALYSSAFEARTMALVTGSSQPSVYIQASPSAGDPGNVGIGGKIADEQLTVSGNARVRDTLKTNRLQVQQGPVNPGDVLMASDTDGNAEWQPSPISPPPPNTDWSRTGNAGTNARVFPNTGTNFIGTTDAEPLAFATNDTTWMMLTERGELTLRARLNSTSMSVPDGIVIRHDHSGVSPTSTYVGSVIIGDDACLNSEVGAEVAIGYHTLRDIVSGERNTAVGTNSLSVLSQGDHNTAYGHVSGLGLSEGDFNTFLGSRTGPFNLVGSFFGNSNTLVGYEAQTSNNVDHAVVIGANLRAEHSGAFVTGDANGMFMSSAANRFHTRFAGGYELFTDAPATLGVSVPAGGNSWASISDSTLKANYLPANAELLLSRLDGLKLGTWNYKSQPRTRRHYGPMAQEFFAAYGRDFYGSIGNSTTLQSADVDGLLFILIKGLKDRNEALQQEKDALEERVNRLEKIVEELQMQK